MTRVLPGLGELDNFSFLVCGAGLVMIQVRSEESPTGQHQHVGTLDTTEDTYLFIHFYNNICFRKFFFLNWFLNDSLNDSLNNSINDSFSVSLKFHLNDSLNPT